MAFVISFLEHKPMDNLDPDFKPPINLLDFQVVPSQKLADHFAPSYNRGSILVQPAGTGKTYELAWAMSVAYAKNYFQGSQERPLQPFKTLVLTTAKVVTQFQRVLLQAGVTDCLVTSHSSLQNTTGDGLIHWVPNGLDVNPVWDEDLKPDLIVVDEAQCIRNHLTGMFKIIISAVQQGIKVCLMSATPYTRLSETFGTCVVLGLCNASLESHKNLCKAFTMSNADYGDYNAAAMRRFDDYLLERGLKISAEGIKFAHRVFNKCRLIDFECEEHRELYNAAYEEYLEECRKNNRKTPQGVRAIWVAMIKFRKTAENLRSGQLCKVAIEVGTTQKKQVIIASNFTSTLEIIKRMMIEHHNIPANKIGIIIGGRDCQADIDNFQEGDIDYMLLSLKSGGAGLSLHHDRKNGKARPRYVILPPTWSAIELVQVLGRAHRITSITTTYQDVIWYRDTIEEKVAAKVARKMKSLAEAVTKREVWTDLFEEASEADKTKEEEEELRKIQEEEMEEKDEEGISIIDSLPLQALEEAQGEAN